MNILRIAENIPSVALSFVAVLVAKAVLTYPRYFLARTTGLQEKKFLLYGGMLSCLEE